MGVLAATVALPVAARGRLPERLATHWGGRSPDGSMPLWEAAMVPALLWAALVAALVFAGLRGGSAARAGAWVGAALLAGGVFLAGAQASIVRANLDRGDWRDAGSVGAGVAITAALAVAAGALGWWGGRRAADTARAAGAVGGGEGK
ncbi:DUF1648 domain-containing protein [Streptomyces sp. NPDC046557]|uniref:DUF1648 domain-containing protein n=1 Tax=Streptomyces sp. NPDC046557 TaxID=3155372 RepID=UPI0033FE7C36